MIASWMPTVDGGYQRMLGAIDDARRSVRLEVYIYRSGDPGDRFREALTAAAGRAIFSADWERAVRIHRTEWRRSRTLADRWAGIVAVFLLTKVDPWLARRQLQALS
jgi:hypothetical protein